MSELSKCKCQIPDDIGEYYCMRCGNALDKESMSLQSKHSALLEQVEKLVVTLGFYSDRKTMTGPNMARQALASYEAWKKENLG